MSITVATKLEEAPPGQFAPMVPAEVCIALADSPHALTLYVFAQSRPVGWDLDNATITDVLGWGKYRIRVAKEGLIRAGLYGVERIQDAAGRWSTACRFLAQAASALVTPSAVKPGAGFPARTPPPREKKERGGLLRRHSRSTCKREAQGLPCRDCAAEHGPPEKPRAVTVPAYRPVAEVLAESLDPDNECEHGAVATRCAFCRRRAVP